MLIRYLLFIFLIGISNVIYAQSFYTITVKNEDDKAIPFASIANLSKGNGAYSDSNGVVKFSYNSLNDTIEFSSIGYKTLTTSVSIINGDESIRLKKIYSENTEVIVLSSKNTKYHNIGYHNLRDGGGYYLGAGNRLAVFISNPAQKYVSLAGVYFRMIKRGKCDSKIRVRVIESGSNFSVSNNDLLMENVFIENSKLKKLNYIDIEDYNVIFPPNGAYIVLEILNSGTQPCQEFSYPSIRGTLSLGHSVIRQSSWNSKWAKPPRSEMGKNLTPNIGIKLRY